MSNEPGKLERFVIELARSRGAEASYNSLPLSICNGVAHVAKVVEFESISDMCNWLDDVKAMKLHSVRMDNNYDWVSLRVCECIEMISPLERLAREGIDELPEEPLRG